METEKVRVILGGLLHDIGKVVYRTESTKNHSRLGNEFLKETVGLSDSAVLEQVLCHHSVMIKENSPKENSLAYITYIADNIASGTDRRENEGEDKGYDMHTSLETVFNIINGNSECYKYKPTRMVEKTINYPVKEKIEFSSEIYDKICYEMKDSLKGVEYSENYINLLLEIMEANCAFIPSSTNKGEIADISLYDHSKITAAVGACIFDYLRENKISDYKDKLYKKTKEFYDEDAFLMYSFDLSGIQDFIYTINSKGTLKMLRSRSFYLEILCEHYIDTILEKLNLSRANLIYSGGGHAYLLLANTKITCDTLDELHKEINNWCIKNFKNSLYVAHAYAECSANNLMNKNDTYTDIFKRLSAKLSREKANKYSADDILKFNNDKSISETRECRVCRRSDKLVEEDICPLCKKLIDMSDDILDEPFFVVRNGNNGLALPFGQSFSSIKRDKLTSNLMHSEDYVRCYCKNEMYTGNRLATKIWVGNYHTDKEFTKLAEKSTGIDRIGVIRADVDNLGQAFVSGFSKQHTSLSRTATFSRKLSIFFKKHINTLFEENDYNVLIVYSGGDDVFLVGAWSDTVKAAITLRDAFSKFTQNTLTISAGIGIYSPKFPIASIAYDTGKMEDCSKSEGKNRVTLLCSRKEDNAKYTFEWDEFKNKILGEKKASLDRYFNNQSAHGKNMLYNLLDYLRSIDDTINLARYAYLLARIEPDKDASDIEKENYRLFSKKMYDWAINKEDRLQLIMAIYLYIYEQRKTDKEEK